MARWYLAVPNLPSSSPQGSRRGKEHRCRAPVPLAGLCHQRLHCATASWLVPPGLALAPLCAGSWRVWVCVSNFKGMSYFLEKMDRLSKKQITPTREGALTEALLWTLTGPPGAGSGALHCRDCGERCQGEISIGMPWAGRSDPSVCPPSSPCSVSGCDPPTVITLFLVWEGFTCCQLQY